MAINEIKVPLLVTSNGTTENEIKKAKALKAAYNEAADAASKMGGTQGSRAALAKAMPGGMSGEQYGNMRGSAGATGASARDFANQAQGLGGLVRLYATYAANIFAVGAAFRALSSAMDTTNMIKGLDQLGAATGRNLGTLSKRLVDITDGAISLRESMEAVAKTSSAGMSSKNIERLGMVAKNASLALGVSMPDAISRLSRGITKLEPELLDELGLFTKIGPATDKYALQVGKTAAQLTDFEKRQAFANAVLEEGEEKFKALAEAAANPYDKLISSLKNVAQSGLEVINKVLGPIADLLSKSPTALGAGIAAVASILLKQALPAVGEFRAGLEKSAAMAGAAAVGKAGDAKRAREQLNRVIEAKVEQSAEAQLKIFEDLEAKLYSTAASGATRRSALWKTLKKDIVDIDEADLASTEKSIRRLEAAAKGDPSKKGQADLERRTFEELKKVINAEDELVKIKQVNRRELEGNLAATGQYARIQKAAADYEESAKKKAIISNAAYNTSLLGIRNAWVLMKDDIAASGLQLGRFGTALLVVRAGVASIGAAIGTLGSLINKAFAVFATLSAVFGVLDAVFSKNAKEAATFSSAMDSVDASVQNVNRTLAVMDAKGASSKNTIDSAIALSNAFGEVYDSAQLAVASSQKVKDSMSGWDKFFDNIFSFFGKGVDEKLADGIAAQLKSGMQILSKAGLADEFAPKFKEILGVESLDTETVSKAFLKLSDTGKKAFLELEASARTKLGNVATALENFKTTSDAALLAYKEFIQSTANTSPLFKLGATVQDMATAMQKASGEGVEKLSEVLDELYKKPEKAALFGEAFIEGFIPIREEFAKQKLAIDAYKDNLAQLKESLSSTQDAIKKPGGKTEIDIFNLKQREKKLTEQIATTQNILNDLPKTAIDQAFKLANEASVDAAKRGADLVKKAITEAHEKAGIAIAKAAAAALTGEQRAREEQKLAMQDLNIQMKAIDVNLDLLNSQEKLTAAIQESNAYAQIALGKQSGNANLISSGESQVAVSKAVRQVLSGSSKEEVLSGLTKEQQGIFGAQFAPVERRQAEQRAAKIALQGQMGAQAITGKLSIAAGGVQDQQRVLDIENQITKQKQTQLTLISSVAGINVSDLNTAQNILDQASLENDQLKERQNIELAISNAKLSYQATGSKNAKEEIAKQENILRLTEKKQKLEMDNFKSGVAQKALTSELDRINKKYELTNAQFDLDKTIATEKLNSEAQELSLYSSLYEYSKDIVIDKQAAIDKQKALLELTNATKVAEDAMAKKREETDARKSAILGDSPEAIAARKALDDELTRQQVLTNLSLASTAVQVEAKLTLIEKTKALNLEQEKYNQLLKDSSSLTENLRSLFGDLGQTVGEAVNAMANLAVTSAKNAQAQLKLEEDLAKAKQDYGQDSDEAKKAQKALDKQKKEGFKAELDGIAQTAGATKKMFAEKSAGFKLMSTIEKTTAAVSMALKVQDMAMNLATLPGKIAGGVSQLFNQGGWAGFAGAAAFLALMASLGGGGASSAGANVMQMPDSAQRQETQGTGYSWANDNSGALVKVENGGGVFGDPGAKLDSINKGIELLNEHTITGLDYDNRVLRTLEKIATALGAAAKSIYNVPGIRTGMNFGSMPGTTRDKEWYQDIPLVGGLLGNIFGGGTTASTSITSAGIQITGTFDQLINDTSGRILQYKDLMTQWHEDGGWFGSDDDWTTFSRQTQGVSADIQNAFRDIFSSAKTMFIEVAKSANMSTDTVMQAFATLSGSTEIDIMNKTGKEVLDELNAVISADLDRISNTIFSAFGKYKEFGEALTDTVLRVVDTSMKVEMALKSMNNTMNVAQLSVLSFTSKFDITEALVKNAGGLTEFMDQAAFFTSNFLTEAERMAPIEQSVKAELARLGVSANQSRESFKALVQSINLTTAGGRNLYQGLMDVAPGLDMLLKYQESLTKQDTSLEALKNTAKALKTSFESLTKTLRGQITAIKDYITSLTTGAQSVYTATQRYSLAKAEITRLVSIINTPTTTLAEEEVRNAAISKLSASTDKFLELSRNLYSSGSQYTSDFNTVLDVMNSVGASLETQLTDTQRQLNALIESNTFLQSIDDSSKTTAELLKAYLIAGGIPLPGGSFAVGTNYVPNDMIAQIHQGERIIPAADNFKLMSRLNNSDNYSQEMLAQIRALNQKIDSLERTVAEGAAINAEATNRNTNEISGVIGETTGRTIQANRLQAKAVIK